MDRSKFGLFVFVALVAMSVGQLMAQERTIRHECGAWWLDEDFGFEGGELAVGASCPAASDSSPLVVTCDRVGGVGIRYANQKADPEPSANDASGAATLDIVLRIGQDTHKYALKFAAATGDWESEFEKNSGPFLDIMARGDVVEIEIEKLSVTEVLPLRGSGAAIRKLRKKCKL